MRYRRALLLVVLALLIGACVRVLLRPDKWWHGANARPWDIGEPAPYAPYRRPEERFGKMKTEDVLKREENR